MANIERLELDGHRSAIIADVKRLVEKYRAIFDWDVPDIDQAAADKDPVDGGSGNGAMATPVHLEHQPFRPPLGVSTAQLANRRLHLGRDLPWMGMNLVTAVG